MQWKWTFLCYGQWPVSRLEVTPGSNLNPKPEWFYKTRTRTRTEQLFAVSFSEKPRFVSKLALVLKLISDFLHFSRPKLLSKPEICRILDTRWSGLGYTFQQASNEPNRNSNTMCDEKKIWVRIPSHNPGCLKTRTRIPIWTRTNPNPGPLIVTIPTGRPLGPWDGPGRRAVCSSLTPTIFFLTILNLNITFAKKVA